MLLATGRFFNGAGGGGGPATDWLLLMVAGQSNARSYDTTGSDVPVPLQASDPDILIWNTQTNALEEYEAGTNSDAWNSGASTPQKWGPEAAFAHAFRAANPTVGVVIVKVAVDSTTLAVDAADDWSPSNTGELFDDMTAEIAAALSALGDTPVDNVLLWMQGEHDALNGTHAGNYGVNLDDFIDNVRIDWAAAATVILGRISPSADWATGGSSVRAFQARIARDMSDVQAIDTDSYTRAADDAHYVAASVQTMGEDMFDAYDGTYPLLPVKFGTMAADKYSGVTLSNGNLTAAGTGVTSSNLMPVRCDQVLSGKCYWEVLIDAQIASLNVGAGKFSVAIDLGEYWGKHADSIGYNTAGAVFKNASQIQTYSAYTAGDRVQVAFDTATGKIWFGKNGTFNGSPAAGTGQASTMSATTTTSLHRIGATLRRSGDQVTLKVAAADFAYTPPSGFAAI
jgi:hypothetical protein